MNKIKTKFKKFIQRMYPTELEHAIEIVMLKYDYNKKEDVDYIDAMLKELVERKEFNRLINYNRLGENEDRFRIKNIFVNEKYVEQTNLIKSLIHSNNGTYDRVLKRIREYHENLDKKSRIGEVLNKLCDYENTEDENISFPEMKSTVRELYN